MKKQTISLKLTIKSKQSKALKLPTKQSFRQFALVWKTIVLKVGNPQRMTSLSSATPGNIRIKISSMISRESRKCMGCYENGALKGKLGIANEQKLRKVEYMTVVKRSATLPARPTALRRCKQQAWLDPRCPQKKKGRYSQDLRASAFLALDIRNLKFSWHNWKKTRGQKYLYQKVQANHYRFCLMSDVADQLTAGKV